MTPGHVVDHDEGDLPVFESGAIMMYLADKEGKFLPQDRQKRAAVISWLMFQMASFALETLPQIDSSTVQQ